jgi:hypothetical protein
MDIEQYIEYLKNVGEPSKIINFDDDFEPIGPKIREYMRTSGIIVEVDRKIYLTQDN